MIGSCVERKKKCIGPELNTEWEEGHKVVRLINKAQKWCLFSVPRAKWCACWLESSPRHVTGSTGSSDLLLCLGPVKYTKVGFLLSLRTNDRLIRESVKKHHCIAAGSNTEIQCQVYGSDQWPDSHSHQNCWLGFKSWCYSLIVLLSHSVSM